MNERNSQLQIRLYSYSVKVIKNYGLDKKTRVLFSCTMELKRSCSLFMKHTYTFCGYCQKKYFFYSFFLHNPSSLYITDH